MEQKPVTLLDIISTIGGLVGVIAAGYTAFRVRAIEAYKAQLRREGFEHETRFARLHEKRLEVVAKLYALLVRAERAMTEFVNPLELAGGRTKDDLAVDAEQSMNSFRHFFQEHRIYMEPDLVKDIQGILDVLWGAGMKFSIYRRRNDESDRYFERWGEAWDQVSKSVPVLRESIEERFRHLLGIGEAKHLGPGGTRDGPGGTEA